MRHVRRGSYSNGRKYESEETCNFDIGFLYIYIYRERERESKYCVYLFTHTVYFRVRLLLCDSRTYVGSLPPHREEQGGDFIDIDFSVSVKLESIQYFIVREHAYFRLNMQMLITLRMQMDRKVNVI